MTKAAELAKMGEVLTNSQIGGRRNIIINGAMNVAQRSTGVTGVDGAGYYTHDRWKIEMSASAGRFTQTQTADGPNGISANCLKLDCTTADTSIASNEYLILTQVFEGQDLQGIGKGVSGAKQVTLSFYVKANAAFTFIAEFQDQDNGRLNGKTFATTTDWVRHEITFEADEDDGSSPFDDDNAASARINFWLHSGSDYTSGTLASGWENRTDVNRAAGVGSFFSSTDNNFFITGVQLEVGSQATPFEHRSFGEELRLCERYFEKLSTTVSYHILTTGQCFSATSLQYFYPFKVPKRASASFTFSAAGTFSAMTSNGSNAGAASAIDTTSTTNEEMRGTITVGSGLSAGNASFLIHNGLQSDEAIINIDAEL